MLKTRDNPATAESFERHSGEVLGHLRAAFGAVIAAIPGGVRRASDLKKTAGLDMKLSWRLFKVAHAADPYSSGPHVPSQAGIKSFLRVSKRLGVREELLAAVERAVGEFDRLVAAHAGDRSTFDSMISALASGSDAAQANLQQRRAAFRANRHIWGVQAETQLKCVFTNVAEDPSRVDVAVVDGYALLRQLRHDAPLVLTSTRVADDDGNPLPVVRQPIDPRATSQHGVALLRDFCSEPTPELNEVSVGSGFVCGELTSTGLGMRGALTCFTGWSARNIGSRHSAAHNTHAIVQGAVRIPCETMTICLLTRAGALGDADPAVRVFSDHQAELPYPVHKHALDRVVLPDEGVVYLGRGASVLSSPEIPRLQEMARYVFTTMGWDESQFDIHRCRIAYPILPSSVAISIELPSAPSN
ncbi:MAG: hypothetical protein GY716_19290 [bacterium]|nr:hypothetical protein [bacterium]